VPTRPSVAAAAWQPLREPLFRALWIASVASNVGTAIHGVGAAWLMTSLSPSPLLVALIQTAASLPLLLLALPAGALADVVDRRRLLLVTQSWMLAAAAGLGALTLAGWTTPLSLLALTFTMGLGNALNAPAWQAITPELVPREELPEAVAMGSAGFNLARAVGPALGGLVVAAAGPAAAFLLNAASFVGVLFVIQRWRREPPESLAPAEQVLGAIRAGNRYVRYAPALRAVLARLGAFIVGGSAIWALLPLIARQQLRLSPAGYGLLLGCFGAGAVAAAVLLPGLRARLAPDRLVVLATLLFAAITAGLAGLRSPLAAGAALAAAGFAWLAVLSTLNVEAQVVVPAWVRARALSFYLLVMQGGLAAGSALWGSVAARAGMPTALLAAAAALLLGAPAALRYRLRGAEGAPADLTPSLHWPDPTVAAQPHPQQGPVLVTVDYRIDPRRWREFATAMRAVGRLRRRDGAYRWSLFRDTADPGHWLETFVTESWAEHLRQHERFTVADRAIEDRVNAFQLGDQPPAVSHYLYAYHPSEWQ
jgi:MFS family permease